MASLAILVAVAIVLVATSQVSADYTKVQCRDKYGISSTVWDFIMDMKRPEWSSESRESWEWESRESRESESSESESSESESSESESRESREFMDNCAVDGDELLTRAIAQQMWEDLRHGGGHRNKRKVIDFENYHPDSKWTERTLRYYIDRDFDMDQENNIKEAMAYVSTVTCFGFSEVAGASEALVHFVQDESCLTFMGRVPDDELPHEIYLNAECAGRVGEIVHQMGHMLGLWHEHQRPDRDDYVKINTDNIKSGEAGNYMVFDDLIDTLDMPYDRSSLMHYKSTQFARVDDEEIVHTMEASDNTPERLRPWARRMMGQRVELSFFDLKTINQVYCSEDCPSNQQSCRNNGYRNPRSCSECVCPDGFGGNTCNIKGVYNSQAGCGGRIEADSSEKLVSSPGYGSSPYGVFITCSWFIEASAGKRIEMEFKDEFGVYARGEEETCYHWVEIRTGDDLTLPGTRFCGQNRPDLTLTSDTNDVMVVFKSLYQANETYRTGFKLSVREVNACADNPCENGGTCTLDDNEESGYRCRCTDDFDGVRCSDNNEEGCPCFNDGSCIDHDDGEVYCSCLDGFEGELCNHGCGTCEMPERSYGKQEAEPCYGYREAEKEVCTTSLESYTHHSRWGRRRRRTRYRTVTDCKMEDDTGDGYYCGCGWELYEDRDGKLMCAMTGYGEYGECECYGRECRQGRYNYRVLSDERWGYWWWCGTYGSGWKEYEDCPDGEWCDEDCDHHGGWGWGWRRR